MGGLIYWFLASQTNFGNEGKLRDEEVEKDWFYYNKRIEVIMIDHFYITEQMEDDAKYGNPYKSRAEYEAIHSRRAIVNVGEKYWRENVDGHFTARDALFKWKTFDLKGAKAVRNSFKQDIIKKKNGINK